MAHLPSPSALRSSALIAAACVAGALALLSVLGPSLRGTPGAGHPLAATTAADTSWSPSEGRRLGDVPLRLTGHGSAQQRGLHAFRPIFMMHGLGVSADWDCKLLAEWVQQAHPGTATYPIAMFEDWPISATPLDVQIEQVAEYIRKEVNSTPALFAEGYHLVCHSQGALICRALAQYMDDHRIHTLVSLAGPQMGVYGLAYFTILQKFPLLRKFTYDNVYAFAYTEFAQKTLSVANLWDDPVHHDELVRRATWLAVYNGLTSDGGNAARKANFVRLEKAVFLTGIPRQGDWDGGLQPFYSGVFDYLADGNQTMRVPMKSQNVYIADTIGLRTLDEAGKLVTEAVPDVSHRAWVADKDVFTRYILPHLV